MPIAETSEQAVVDEETGLADVIAAFVPTIRRSRNLAHDVEVFCKQLSEDYCGDGLEMRKKDLDDREEGLDEREREVVDQQEKLDSDREGLMEIITFLADAPDCQLRGRVDALRELFARSEQNPNPRPVTLTNFFVLANLNVRACA